MGFGSFLSDVVSGASDLVSGASDLASDVGDALGGGDVLDSVGGFFDAARESLGGDLGGIVGQVTDTLGGGGVFGAVTDRLGDLGDLGGIGEQVGGIAGQVSEAVSGGGWSDAIGGLIGQAGGEEAGGLGGLIGGFGSLLGGGGGGLGGAISDLVPSGISDALSEGLDLPLVGDALGGSWQEVAGSLPGLAGSLGSLGIGASGIAGHVEEIATQVVDSGAVWATGLAVADAGPQFLGHIAEVTEPGRIWDFIPGAAADAGVPLPEWADGLAANPLGALDGEWDHLAGGGVMPPSPEGSPADPFEAPDPAPAATADDTGFEDTGLEDTGLEDTGLEDTGLEDTGLEDTGLDDTGLDDVGAPAPAGDEGLGGLDEPMVEPEPAPVADLEPEPAPAPDPEPDFDPAPPPPPEPAPEPASSQIESDFDAIGDDAFGA